MDQELQKLFNHHQPEFNDLPQRTYALRRSVMNKIAEPQSSFWQRFSLVFKLSSGIAVIAVLVLSYFLLWTNTGIIPNNDTILVYEKYQSETKLLLDRPQLLIHPNRQAFIARHFSKIPQLNNNPKKPELKISYPNNLH